MKVIAVVLCYNSADYISNCLKSLKDVETVIVDNASSDKSIKFIETNFPKIKIIINLRNLGYAGGNNIGIKYALEQNADFVWIVNPDVEVAPDALKEALKVIQSDQSVAVVGSKVYFASGFEFHKERYKDRDLGRVIWYAGGDNDWKNVYARHWGINEVDRGQFEKESEVEFATGSSMLIRVEALQKVGLIDEKYFLYYEENDLCQRIRKAGYVLKYAPKSIVWHQVGQAAGIGSALADYYTTRNRMLFGMRWAPWRSKFALFRESLRLLFWGRKWQKRGVLDFYLGHFGKGSYDQ